VGQGGRWQVGENLPWWGDGSLDLSLALHGGWPDEVGLGGVGFGRAL
jgi:hypothetical protein